MPHSQPRILPRQTITRALTDAINRFPLVVLAAPMGYGKTTAVRELRDTLAMRIFSTTIPQGAHSALYLWESLYAQLTAQGARLAPSLLRAGVPLDAPQRQRLVDHAKPYLSSCPSLWIIDDYHFANVPEMNDFITLCAEQAVPGFCILMLTRTRPSLPLSHLCANNRAMLFDQELLTFSPQEAIAYFQLNDTAEPQPAESAWAFSEGWAVALWLCMQNYRAHGVIKACQDIEALISETAFSTYAPGDQKLLLQLSLFDSFSPAQAAMVANDPAAPQRLHLLHNDNAFITYDPESDSYRLHSIFRTYLARSLAEEAWVPAQTPPRTGATIDSPLPATKEIDIPGLFRRAGEWFAQQGDRIQALRFFSQAGRDEDLLRLLECFAEPESGHYLMFDPEGVAAMIHNIPWSVRRLCPMGYLAFVYHYMSRVNLTKGLRLLEEARFIWNADPSFSPAERRRIEGEMELILGLESFNDLFAMREHHKKAHLLLEGHSSLSQQQLLWTFGSPHAAFLYLREPGTYKELVERVGTNLFYYQEITGGCSAGAHDLFQAEFLLETDALHRVQSSLAKAMFRAVGQQQIATRIAISFTQARLYLAGGEADKAKGVLDDLAPLLLRNGNSLLFTSLDLFRGYIAAVRHSEEEIPLWLRHGELTASRNFHQGANFATIVHGKALLARKKWSTLEALAEDIPYNMGKYNNVFGRIHAKIFLAIAASHLHGRDQALHRLREGIALARPDGILCSIAEYGIHINALLLHLREWNPADGYLHKLAKMTRHYVKFACSENTLHPEQPTPLPFAKPSESRRSGTRLRMPSATEGPFPQTTKFAFKKRTTPAIKANDRE